MVRPFLLSSILLFASSAFSEDEHKKCEESYYPIVRGTPSLGGSSLPSHGLSGEAEVVVKAVIDTSGNVLKTEVQRTTNRYFNRSAENAVKENKYDKRDDICIKLESVKYVFEKSKPN